MAAFSGAFAQGNTDVRSTGPCSPNVVSNSDSVTITVTCSDLYVGNKISEILAEILKGQERTVDIRETLDIILELLGRDLQETRKAIDLLAEQHRQRSLTPDQAERLAALLREAGKQKIAFRHSLGHGESYQFLQQLQDVILEKAGWSKRDSQLFVRVRGEPYGLWVFVSDVGRVDETHVKAPLGATALIRALREVGLKVQVMAQPIEEGTFELIVGLPEPVEVPR